MKKTPLLIAAALLCASPSLAATCYVKEYAVVGIAQQGPIQVAAEPSLVDQTVTFTSTAGNSAPFNLQTRYIRVWCDAQASYVIDQNAVATNTKSPLSASAAEYFGVQPGHRLSVIANP